MTTRRGSRLASVVAGAVLVGALAAVGSSQPVSAHGSVTFPVSRYLACFEGDPSPRCAEAWAANPQALYDWTEVNIPDAASRHTQLIPDGQLCGAGRAKYAAFDQPAPGWPTTAVTAGPMVLQYRATAPHATAYFKVFLTRDGFDPTGPLHWGDLELIRDTGSLPALAAYSIDLDLPARTGQHVMYVVWQRSDSPEAFYSCSDVVFGGPPSTTSPGTTAPATTMPPAGFGYVDVTSPARIDSDWGSGYCATHVVTNNGSDPLRWRVTVTPEGPLTSSWSGSFAANGTSYVVTGLAWNEFLAPGATTDFGYCAQRGGSPPATTVSPTTAPSTTVPPTTLPPTTVPTTAPTTTAPPGAATVRVHVDTDWGTGWCSTVTVSNPTAAPLRWTAGVALVGSLSSLWNAVGSVSGGVLNVAGAAWNDVLAPGATTTFGFCAAR